VVQIWEIRLTHDGLLQALWNLVFWGPRIIDYSLMLQAAQTESLPILQRILVVQ